MTMFGGSSTVDIDSPASFGQLDVSSDRVIPYFQQLAGRVHSHGAATMCQITHMGRRTSAYVGDWLTTIAPSPIREPIHERTIRARVVHQIPDVTRTSTAMAAKSSVT